jgi:4-amino-4-deoxy-L-arabinose transferase-like glycosyltransferase
MMTSELPLQPTQKRASVIKSEGFWLALIFGVGASLRLYALDFQSLWQDEGLQFYVATQNSFSELFHQTRSFHPPLSFIINHVFLLMGESDFFLRLPSALLGIASLPILYVLARELTSKKAAVFAVFVLAISPFHIWYSQDSRMYSQLLFLSLLSSVLLLQALRRGEVSWWIYYVIVSAAGMYTHVFMGLALAAQFLWVVVYQRQHLLRIMASGFAVALLFLPWALFLPWVTGFARNVSADGLVLALASDGRARFSWPVVPYTVFVYSAGFSLGPSVAELHVDKSFRFILAFLPSITVVMSVSVILLGIGIWAIKKSYGARAAMFCLLGLFIPLVGTALYSLTPRAGFNVRYTVTAFPYFCLLVGTGAASLARANKTFGALAVVALIGISAASLYNRFTNPRYANEDIRSAVAFWRQKGGDEALIAFGSPYPAHRYVAPLEAERLFTVGGKDIVSSIEQVFVAQDISSAYVVLARDWDSAAETAIRNAFGGTLEGSFPGVQVFRISSPKTFRTSDPSAASAPSHQP